MRVTTWDKNSLTEEASKYKNRSAFMEGSSGAYTAARRMKLLDALFPGSKPYRNWSRAALIEEASKHESRKAFRIAERSGYNAAYRMGILDELFPVDKSVKG